MNHKTHNQIVSFIWSIADDVLRDVFVRGKYRDIILPFTVLRRIDALLVDSKGKVLEANQHLIQSKIDNKDGLKKISGYPFYNISGFTFADSSKKDAKFPFTSLMNDPDNIDTNLETYLDGFSPNIQEIISKFKIRNQLETMREAGITYGLIEKLSSKEINVSPVEAINSKGEKLPPLTNLGMGYVFEELIRRFNEENNEEAGEHFTPREIIKLMTQLVFLPVKDQLKKGGSYLIYDPACGSGGMLTEAEHFAEKITDNSLNLHLYGQEVNPETWAICTGDMLIKGEEDINIAYGSTLASDGFIGKEFDFMLTNPPYGKSWKKDEDAIVTDRGKKGKETIKDSRFSVGLPTISDGQLLFLMNMVHKMKKHTELGSRIASVHNGSSLFTGDAGSGESEMRRYFIENDLVEAIIALPEHIFYNTGIPTYVWILSNRKPKEKRGKVQLINALEMYEPLRRNLGQKNCVMKQKHIDNISEFFFNFKESNVSKIFDNSDFGYWKITVERPLRLKASFTSEAVNSLRFIDALSYEMKWVYENFGDDVYTDLKPHKQKLETWISKNEIKITPANKKKLLNIDTWKQRKLIMEAAIALLPKFEGKEYINFNLFTKLVDKELTTLKISLSATDKKAILHAVSWKDEEADPVIKKTEKDGTIIYEPDTDLRDSENVPLSRDIQDYFDKEVIPYVPDAWIDHDKTVKGYSISFTRYFYNYEPPRDLDEIKKEILRLEQETEGILEEIVNE